MSRRTVLIALSLALLPSGLSAQRIAQDSAAVNARPQTVGLAILGGTAGSALGLAAGFGLGALADVAIGKCNGDDPYGEGSFCAVVPGAIFGSILGSALGANRMARRRGGSPSLRSSLVAAAGGLLTGAFGAAAARAISDSDAAPIIGFSLGQGLVTGMFAGGR